MVHCTWKSIKYKVIRVNPHILWWCEVHPIHWEVSFECPEKCYTNLHYSSYFYCYYCGFIKYLTAIMFVHLDTQLLCSPTLGVLVTRSNSVQDDLFLTRVKPVTTSFNMWWAVRDWLFSDLDTFIQPLFWEDSMCIVSHCWDRSACSSHVERQCDSRLIALRKRGRRGSVRQRIKRQVNFPSN